MSGTVKNPFQHIVEPLDPKDPKHQFYNLSKLGDPRYGNNRHETSFHSVSGVAYTPERFTVHLFFRPFAVLHPDPPGVRCQEL